LTVPEQRNGTQASGRTRRRLTPDQQREVARLYSETSASTAEIRDQFGIGESSLYRVLQKHAVSLRGRGTRRAGRAAPSVSTSTSDGESPRRGTRRRRPVGSSPRRVTRSAATASGAARQFRVHFEGQQVFDARDVGDALRQAEALGVMEVLGVTRLS
jgi:transposase-like protein